jgi:hypothetical protein
MLARDAIEAFPDRQDDPEGVLAQRCAGQQAWQIAAACLRRST